MKDAVPTRRNAHFDQAHRFTQRKDSRISPHTSRNPRLGAPKMAEDSPLYVRTQDGISLAYDTCGNEGPVIVLLHGALALSKACAMSQE